MSLESKLLHPRYHPGYHPGISAQPMIPESARAEFWPTTTPRRVGLASCARGAQRAVFCAVRVPDFLAEGAGWGASPGHGGPVGRGPLGRCLKNCEIGVGFSFAALSVFRLRRAEAISAVWIPHWHSEPFESQGARAAKRWT